MSRPYELSDFPGLLEKYADFRPLGRSRWSSDRERNNTVPSAKRLSANGLPIATEKPTKIALETMPCATPKFSR